MRSFQHAVVLLLIVSLSACGLFGRRHRHSCEGHYDGPFQVSPGGPGAGIVLGTADFDSKGAVLIKIQIEDLGAISGDHANITAWSGNGPRPADASVVPPPGGTIVYETTGDVALRHFTTHLDRNYDEAQDRYWLFVRVDHRLADGSRDVDYLWWEWQPSTSPRPDSAHDFNQY